MFTIIMIMIINMKRTALKLGHHPQTVAAHPFPGRLKRELRSSSGWKISKNNFLKNCILGQYLYLLLSRSYIDAPKKMGKKFDLILDDGRAR